MTRSSFGLFESQDKSSPTNLTSKKATEIILKPIPYLPLEIKSSKLQKNSCLLDQKTIEDMSSRTNIGKNSKKSLSTHCSVLRFENSLFAIGPKLGKGNSGRVRLLQDLRTLQWQALKIFDIENTLTASFRKTNVKTEYENLKELKLDLQAPHFRYSPSKKHEQGYLLMQLVQGIPLITMAENFDLDLPPIFWIQIALDIVDELLIFHQVHQMIHCDLKPANVIYNLAEKKAKLIDVGFALKKNIHGYAEEKVRGTALYMDPSLRSSWEQTESGVEGIMVLYNEKTDIYALGILLASLFQIFDPPQTKEKFDFSQNYIVQEGHNFYDFNLRIQNKLLLKDIVIFLNKMTAISMNERPQLEEVKIFFTKMKNNALSLENAKIKVGFLNVDEYIECDTVQREELEKKLKQVHEVRLIDTTDRGDEFYIKLCELLQFNIPIVGTNVVISSDLSNITSFLEILINSENDGKLNGCYEPHFLSNQIDDKFVTDVNVSPRGRFT